MKYIYIIVLCCFFSSAAYAGCWSGGVEYPEGTVKGSMICGADGYWRPNE